jgi:hypothetical protein
MPTIVDDMVTEILRTESDLVQMKCAANAFARRLGIPEPYPDIADGTVPATRAIPSKRVRPDQFATCPAPSTATREFLQWRGREAGSATLDEILSALRDGGFDFGTRAEATIRANLKTALAKDTQVQKLANGTYGLAEWYGGPRPLRSRKAQPEARQEELKPAPEQPDLAVH